MQFILSDSRTYESLSEWSQGNPIQTIPFFFWSTGSDEQKSLTGLLRALLFQILARETSLIDHLYQRDRNKVCIVPTLASWAVSPGQCC
jgi:hypothetical protein